MSGGLRIGLYSRSLGFFVAIAVVGFGFWALTRPSLQAIEPATSTSSATTDNILELTLSQDGHLYAGQTRLGAELITQPNTDLFRYQVINQPQSFLDSLVVRVTLPQPGSEGTIGHRFVSNGGAESVDSQLVDPQTVVYTATGISSQAQLTIELEVPKSFIGQSPLLVWREKLAAWPASVWTLISIGLPSLALLVLFLVALARSRRPQPINSEVDRLPSRLAPALLGILLNGRISSRELAATFVDLARRGHLVIRQVSYNDFRFRRHAGTDQLADFEQALLDQIFGPASETANHEEISFGLAQELFSQRISQAFALAYRQMNELGYFYTNPLTLHRRYQVTGFLLFLLGVAGFIVNWLLLPDIRYSLIFWLAMILTSLLTVWFARGLPSRTIFGDREISRWLAFRRYLTNGSPANYAAHSQEKYLAYLPYAIVFEIEPEWTRRFYDLPFAQPSWYIAPNISTIDQFANGIFPLFGYLSHALALSSAPATR